MAERGGGQLLNITQFQGPFTDVLSTPLVMGRAGQQQFSGAEGTAGAIMGVASRFLEGVSAGRLRKFQQQENENLKQMARATEVLQHIESDPDVTPEAKAEAGAQFRQILAGRVHQAATEGERDKANPQRGIFSVVKSVVEGMTGGPTPKGSGQTVKDLNEWMAKYGSTSLLSENRIDTRLNKSFETMQQVVTRLSQGGQKINVEDLQRDQEYQQALQEAVRLNPQRAQAMEAIVSRGLFPRYSAEGFLDRRTDTPPVAGSGGEAASAASSSAPPSIPTTAEEVEQVVAASTQPPPAAVVAARGEQQGQPSAAGAREPDLVSALVADKKLFGVEPAPKQMFRLGNDGSYERVQAVYSPSESRYFDAMKGSPINDPLVAQLPPERFTIYSKMVNAGGGKKVDMQFRVDTQKQALFKQQYGRMPNERELFDLGMANPVGEKYHAPTIMPGYSILMNDRLDNAEKDQIGSLFTRMDEAISTHDLQGNEVSRVDRLKAQLSYFENLAKTDPMAKRHIRTVRQDLTNQIGAASRLAKSEADLSDADVWTQLQPASGTKGTAGATATPPSKAKPKASAPVNREAFGAAVNELMGLTGFDLTGGTKPAATSSYPVKP